MRCALCGNPTFLQRFLKAVSAFRCSATTRPAHGSALHQPVTFSVWKYRIWTKASLKLPTERPSAKLQTWFRSWLTLSVSATICISAKAIPICTPLWMQLRKVIRMAYLNSARPSLTCSATSTIPRRLWRTPSTSSTSSVGSKTSRARKSL